MNLNISTRMDTYTIEEFSGNCKICLNSPATRLGNVGDEVIIVSYIHLSEK